MPKLEVIDPPQRHDEALAAEDPETQMARLSAMLQRKLICNGAATGRMCRHYMLAICQTESSNPENLKHGLFKHLCLVTPGHPIEWERGVMFPHTCTHYAPRRRTLLELIRGKDPGRYDPDQWQGYTPEEIAEIQARMSAQTKAGRMFNLQEDVELLKHEHAAGVKGPNAADGPAAERIEAQERTYDNVMAAIDAAAEEEEDADG